MKKRCIHCNKKPVNRPRGLCWHCYHIPEVIALYPPTSKFTRKGVLDFNGKAILPSEPTQAPAGSTEKIAVLEKRASLGHALWHPNDNLEIINDTSKPGCKPGPRRVQPNPVT